MKEEGKNIDANGELVEAIINLAGQVVNAYINDTGEDRALDPLRAAYKVLDAGFQKYAAAIHADERKRCANRAVEYALGQNWVSDDNDGDAIAFYSAMINPEGNHV